MYSGGFSQGTFSGMGVLYTNGLKCYEGNFANGLYNGTGTLYQNGNIIYQGEFENVQPDVVVALSLIHILFL